MRKPKNTSFVNILQPLIQKDFHTIHTKNKPLRIYKDKQQTEKHIKLANRIFLNSTVDFSRLGFERNNNSIRKNH